MCGATLWDVVPLALGWDGEGYWRGGQSTLVIQGGWI